MQPNVNTNSTESPGQVTNPVSNLVPPAGQQLAATAPVAAPIAQQPAPQTPGTPGPTGSVSAEPAANTPQTAPNPVPKKANSTQNSLLISELRESMVVMSDGSFRAVVACKSINFDLMSSQEREGVEYSYQNFLNALYFPIQIFIRSERIDIEPYLSQLDTIRRQQDNMLLGVLMDDYINFIDILSQEANIMDKSFFIVIPYFPSTGADMSNVKDKGKNMFSDIFGIGGTKAKVTKIDKASYDKAKDEVQNRVDSVMSSLAQVGIQSTRLNTKQLGELYYNIYNPDTSVRQPLVDFESVTSPVIKKATTGAATTPSGGQI